MADAINNTKAAASTLFLGHNGEWWDWSLIIAGILVALAAIAAVLATAGSIISHKREATATEQELARYKVEASVKIEEAKKEGIEAGKAAGDALVRAAEANEGAAKAHERIAELTAQAEEARKETAQAKVELLKLQSPRQFDLDKFKKEIENLPKGSFEVFFDQSSPDASFIATLISLGLKLAHWTTLQEFPTVLPAIVPSGKTLDSLPGLKEFFLSMSLGQRAGGAAWGVSVVTNTEPDPDKNKLGAPLMRALSSSLSGPNAGVHLGKALDDMPDGKVRIIVAPRLP